MNEKEHLQGDLHEIMVLLQLLHGAGGQRSFYTLFPRMRNGSRVKVRVLDSKRITETV